MINDPTDASRCRRRRAVIPITVGVALCLITLGVWLIFAVRGEEGRGEQARGIELEVTSEDGQVRGLMWKYPDDGYQIHEPSDRPIKTPWSRRIDVKSAQGPVVLSVIDDSDSTEATCRILANGKVMEESSGPFAQCMTTVQRAFPAS